MMMHDVGMKSYYISVGKMNMDWIEVKATCIGCTICKRCTLYPHYRSSFFVMCFGILSSWVDQLYFNKTIPPPSHFYRIIGEPSGLIQRERFLQESPNQFVGWKTSPQELIQGEKHHCGASVIKIDNGQLQIFARILSTVCLYIRKDRLGRCGIGEEHDLK